MTQTIGSLDTARMLYSHFPGGDPTNRYGEYIRAPRGFRRIGEGCYRVAYLERATNTVYKIGTYSANVSESANARRLLRKSTRNLPIQLRIPRTRTYRMRSTPGRGGYLNPACVVAQEFAPAKGTICNRLNWWWGADDENPNKCTCKAPVCYAKAHEVIRDWSGLDDIHWNNVLVDKSGVFWIIDLAC